MKNKNLLIIILLISSLLVGCTTDKVPDKENGEENGVENGAENQNGKPDPVVSKEIPENYPEELVPLYGLTEVEGVITVGDDYYQAYYYSDQERTQLLEQFKEYLKDKEVEVFEQESLSELSGVVDGNTIRIYIMPYTNESTTEPSVTTTEDPNTQTYNSTVIIFIYANTAVKAQ